MLEISTRTLTGRKDVLIDGQGYSVRRLGNIEKLNMSQYLRRLEELAAVEKDRALTAEESKELDAISLKIERLYVGMFDDGGDQSKSKALIESLDDIALADLLTQVFSDEGGDE